MTLYGIKKEKDQIREKCLQIRRGIPKDIKAGLERKICENIIGSVSYKYYDTLLLYAALYDEPDLSYLAEKALSDGKRVAYPRCIPGSREMRFHYITDLSQLGAGSFGIMEPPEELPVYDTGAPSCSVCFIPAVAADRRGYRVGYGGGYYDRFLSGFNGTLAAVIFSDFLFDHVPHGKFDLQADYTVTEGGILTFVKN